MPTDFAQLVARRIQELRKAQGFSLRELARRSGLPPESVSRSERGVTAITLTNLARLCNGLGVPLPTFFDFGAPPPGKPQPLVQQGVSPAKLRRLLRELEALVGDAEQRQRRANRRPASRTRAASRR